MKSGLVIKQQLKIDKGGVERWLKRVHVSYREWRVFRAERSRGDSHPPRNCCPGWAQSLHRQPCSPSVYWQRRPSLGPAGGIQAHFGPIPVTIWNIERRATVGSVRKTRAVRLLEKNWFSKTHLDEWQARLARPRTSPFRMRQIPAGIPVLLRFIHKASGGEL